MFTGLVAATGIVATVERDENGARLAVQTDLGGRLAPGDSVAVSGVCLTAVNSSAGEFTADVMEETLRRTSLGGLAPGDRINLELPLRAGDPLGGHIVQGHVDGTGVVQSVTDEGFSRIIKVGGPDEVLRYVVEKGSIAIDGVSLTVAGVGELWLTVSLIPETQERTTLGSLRVGESVNIEVDMFAKYAERLAQR
ncbi:MAG: riboflavin synthase [Thermoleophilaceae bacterium]|jgi:riboflavin synthase|nr:riboflavin synthase [Thermoleophilaceae bacterium]